MRLIIVLLAALALALGFLVWRWSRGVKLDINELHRPIFALLRRGFDGGLLFIRVPLSNQFLQLRKYINSPGIYGIEFCFPIAKWSSEHVQGVESYLSEIGIRYRHTGTSQESPLDFVIADFGHDTEGAERCVRHILQKVFLSESRFFLVLLQNGAVDDVLIDR
jgi:hypothetical protein